MITIDLATEKSSREKIHWYALQLVFQTVSKSLFKQNLTGNVTKLSQSLKCFKPFFVLIFLTQYILKNIKVQLTCSKKHRFLVYSVTNCEMCTPM